MSRALANRGWQPISSWYLEIEFNHKLLRYIYGLTNQFTTYCSAIGQGSLRNPRTIRLYESLAQFKSSGLWVTTHAWLK